LSEAASVLAALLMLQKARGCGLFLLEFSEGMT
jgi:hypothetical protein